MRCKRAVTILVAVFGFTSGLSFGFAQTGVKLEAVMLKGTVEVDGKAPDAAFLKRVNFLVAYQDKTRLDMPKVDAGGVFSGTSPAGDGLKKGDNIVVMPCYEELYRELGAGDDCPVGVVRYTVGSGPIDCNFKSVKMKAVTFILKDQEGQPVKKRQCELMAEDIKAAEEKDTPGQKYNCTYTTDDDGKITIPLPQGLPAKYKLKMDDGIAADTWFDCKYEFDQGVTAKNEAVPVAVKKSICTLIVNFKWDPKYSTDAFVHQDKANFSFHTLIGQAVGQLDIGKSSACFYDIKPGKHALVIPKWRVSPYKITGGSDSIEIPVDAKFPYEVTVTLEPNTPVTIKGKVLDSDGKPVNGANVSFGVQLKATDADGLFEIKGIGDSLMIEHANFAGRNIPITDFKTDGIVNEIKLIGHPLFQGKLGGNTDIVGATKISLKAPGPNGHFYDIKPDANGKFSQQIPAGKYTLCAYVLNKNLPFVKKELPTPAKVILKAYLNLLVQDIDIPPEGKTADFDLPNIVKIKVDLKFSDEAKKTMVACQAANPPSVISLLRLADRWSMGMGEPACEIRKDGICELYAPVGKFKLAFVFDEKLAYIASDAITISDGTNETFALNVDKLSDIYFGEGTIEIGKQPTTTQPTSEPAASQPAK